MTLHWQLAFDATDHALTAAGGVLPDAALQQERRGLTHERQQTAAMLARLAGLADIHPAPRLSPFPVSAKLLGLTPTVRACLFDLDGVLTDDPPGADTAYGLARRKSDALTHGLSLRGVNAIGGARRYLEAGGFAGLERGVVSASAAGHAAGLTVIGVGAGEQAELLRGVGAEMVVPGLSALLDRRLIA